MNLDIYDQIRVFTYILGSIPIIGKSICSPFRKESNPSAMFKEYNGVIRYKDFGDNKIWGDCYSVFAQVFNKTNKEAFKEVNNIIITSEFVLNKIEIDNSIIKSNVKKIITPVFKEFDREFLDYWKKRGVSDFSNIKQVDKVIIEKDNIICTINKQELCICYVYETGFKLYHPNSKLKQYKFLSQVKKSMTWFYEGKDILVIAKSAKDQKVWQSLYPEYGCFHVQSENSYFFGKNFLDFCKDYSLILINFDNDSIGIENSGKLKELLKNNEFNVKELFTREKDLTDDYLKYGKQSIKNYINESIKLCLE